LSLFAVYWAFSLTSGLNIGHRHIIPVYPVLFVMAAGAAGMGHAGPRGGLGLSRRAGYSPSGSRLESVWIRPHYLAYFNELVGPKRRLEARGRQLARLGPGPADRAATG
jgi:hypothetical protein